MTARAAQDGKTVLAKYSEPRWVVSDAEAGGHPSLRYERQLHVVFAPSVRKVILHHANAVPVPNHAHPVTRACRKTNMMQKKEAKKAKEATRCGRPHAPMIKPVKYRTYGKA